MKQTETNEIIIITKKLDNACFIDFGTRVVQKKDGGDIYPVYGGGGATFKMDTYNRENCLVVSRFAMSKQCTRFVEGKFYLNDSGLTVRPKNEKELAQEYLDYLLLTLNDTIYSLSRGTAQRNLNVSKFRNLEIKYPDSIELQLHIATILSKAENLIAQRKESIRLLDEFLKSTFLEMFGDPVRNEKKFEIKNLTEFYINPKEGTKCGPFGSALKKDEFKETGIAVWTMDNILKSGEFAEDGCLFISNEKFQELRRYDAKNNDIIISRAGTVGKMCIVKTDKKNSIISSNLIRLRLGKDLLPVYLFSLMKYCQGRVIKLKHGNEDAYTHMSTGVLDKINFPYPSLELQTQFAHIVEKTEALKTQYQQSLQELENLYGSLSQKAFRGELSIKQAAV
ncbi:MAG TPA: restriction endonuclease subunit S [Cyclobacteriaceae bacterium]|nr:restriction endonuclease subunit S [Cyclobacteriaceae bacterium]HRF34147.1 restriction endonuclease subunit S [Cyclobacteriaceae bacterium]